MTINKKFIKPNQIIKLIAKTQHGKNRIAQHGDEWIVQRENTFNNKLLLRSKNATFTGTGGVKSHDLRWVSAEHDEHFEIEGISLQN